MRAHLTDETGQLLFQALAVREDGHPLQKARAARAAAAAAAADEPAGTTVEDVFGHEDDQEADGVHLHGDDTDDADAGDELAAEAVGNIAADVAEEEDANANAAADDLAGADDADGADDAVDADDGLADGVLFGAAGASLPVGSGRADEGTPLASKDQRARDALSRLLADLHAVRPGSGVPVPGQLTLVGPVGALDGQPGAPPGRLVTAMGEVPLTPSQLRRHACRSLLFAVLLDARGRPVGASGQHRHADRRERRAMRATWGSSCAVNGCTLPGEVPHHAEPFWKALVTALKDLVPLSEHHHHDVHDGHKTLRLRDGRLIDEWGWVRAA